jgi:hypothetical protein
MVGYGYRDSVSVKKKKQIKKEKKEGEEYSECGSYRNECDMSE